MRSIEEILSGHGVLSPESLIPLLQEIQAEAGFVSTEAMEQVSDRLGIPMARVFGVATFYNQFRFAPLGRHVIEVCRGTACHVKESLLLAQHLKRRLDLRDHGNSRDGRYTVLTVACLGACSLAPVIRLDGEFHGHLDPAKLDQLLDATEAADAAETATAPGGAS